MEHSKDSKTPSNSTAGWDTSSHNEFYKYYEQQSLGPKTLERFRSTGVALLRLFDQTTTKDGLDVLDIGCGAGAQCRFWLEGGHRYWGVDINQPLVDLARQRASQLQLGANFEVGTATALPFADNSMDICMLPELLEHVTDWQSCVNEAVRVLRSGGIIYISTTNKLCPRQEEFNLPFYSWYPRWLKRYFERRAVTDWPAIANHAKYPAVNWFSYYGLRDYLTPMGFICLDRFDLIDPSAKGSLARGVVSILRALPPMRWLGHLATSYTVLAGRKQA
jgi:ubiquinone/menaquinone biosynthesis C-methylase UbiE